MNRIDLSSIVNLGKNSPLLLALDTSGCQEGSGVVALMFLSSNKTVNPFPQRDAQGITTPSRQLADPYGDIYDSKKPIINRTQVIGSNFRDLPEPDLYSFESEVLEANLYDAPHSAFAVCYRSA